VAFAILAIIWRPLLFREPVLEYDLVRARSVPYTHVQGIGTYVPPKVCYIRVYVYALHIHTYRHTYIHIGIGTYVPPKVCYIRVCVTYTYIQTYIDTYRHRHVCAAQGMLYTCMRYIYIHTYIHTYRHRHVRAAQGMYILVCVTHKSTYVHSSTDIHTYIHTHIHSYRHRHVRAAQGMLYTCMLLYICMSACFVYTHAHWIAVWYAQDLRHMCVFVCLYVERDNLLYYTLKPSVPSLIDSLYVSLHILMHILHILMHIVVRFDTRKIYAICVCLCVCM
jgi:hypothetical protein